MTLFVQSLLHYPLKSAQGVSLSSARLHPFGLELDRRWMLIDSEGNFLSQRICRKLGFLKVTALGEYLTIFWGEEQIHAYAHRQHLVEVEVWNDVMIAWAAHASVNDWLSARLEQPVRLVYCPEQPQRTVDEKYAGSGYFTGFSDGFPILVITQSSLDYLSEKWGSTIDPMRFRPNIIIGGACEPFAEDKWTSLHIGDTILNLVKPCSRCVVPSLIPDVATNTLQPEEGFARFLAEQRRADDGKIYVGQNAVIQKYGKGVITTDSIVYV